MKEASVVVDLDDPCSRVEKTVGRTDGWARERIQDLVGDSKVAMMLHREFGRVSTQSIWKKEYRCYLVWRSVQGHSTFQSAERSRPTERYSVSPYEYEYEYGSTVQSKLLYEIT